MDKDISPSTPSLGKVEFQSEPAGASSSFEIVDSSTLTPATTSSGREYSSGEWLMPRSLGMNILPTGAIRAMLGASCPAPLGIRM